MVAGRTVRTPPKKEPHRHGTEPRSRPPQAPLAGPHAGRGGPPDRRPRGDALEVGARRAGAEGHRRRRVGEGARPGAGRPARRADAGGGNSMTTTLEPTAITRLDDFDYEVRLERLRAYVEQLERADKDADIGSLQRAADLAAVYEDKRW